jgi:putative SOS response-associated peptidase YedK
MAKSNTPCDELCTSQQSKLVAIFVGRRNNQPLIIAGLYRPPSGTQDQAEQICTEVQAKLRRPTSRKIFL